ncbi:MAG TPA: YceH family protein [Acidobacteriaceae bacterium]|nr:YceH family protein [Acidobacteriaceae bacterium]
MAIRLLNAVEARVLGALVEKETTTPEYYPLSLNALVNACNQKNNREPVMQLDEDAVRLALRGLEDRGWAGVARGSEGRVTKYEHRLQEAFNFTRGETAVVCVLLLRGPQTPGELRGRTERIYRFEELEDVVGVLQKLMQREPALVAALPRQPGTKEIRYVELLSGSVESHLSQQQGEMGHPDSVDSHVSKTGDMGHPQPGFADRVERLEAEVGRLREEVAAMRAEMEAMRGQESGAV